MLNDSSSKDQELKFHGNPSNGSWDDSVWTNQETQRAVRLDDKKFIHDAIINSTY